MLERTLNLGILAHVDAGKTTLTERLLYAAGVIDELGRVDDGTTQTDTLPLEQRRGITIKSAVVSFAIDDVAVNLIDTPGHPDFIAEVERVLSVLDGAVLVISAVEGVQSQTPLLMRALQRLGVPTLIFVNKLDRVGADPDRVLEEISARLTPAIVPGVDGPSARLAEVARRPGRVAPGRIRRGRRAPYGRLRAELAAQTGRALVHPVFVGSAKTGEGVDDLMSGIAELLPASAGDAEGPASGSVFKIERGTAGEKIAYVRMFSGTVHARERLNDEKVTAISVFDAGDAEQRASVSAGEIAKLWGLGSIQIGDRIGEATAAAAGVRAADAGIGRRPRPTRMTELGSESRSGSSPSRTRSSRSGKTTSVTRSPCLSTARCRRRSSRRRSPRTTASTSSSTRRRRSTSSVCGGWVRRS